MKPKTEVHFLPAIYMNQLQRGIYHEWSWRDPPERFDNILWDLHVRVQTRIQKKYRT